MNLQKLFEMQKELDDRILAEHPVQPGEDRLGKKVLALLVELGELCQEWRGFKFWSNDQEPRTEEKIFCRYCGGHGEGYFAGHKWTGKKEKCTFCNGTGIEGLKNPLLEEYVDCLHFILSIGLDIGFDPEDWIIKGEQYHDLIEQIMKLIKEIVHFSKSLHEIDYVQILELFIGLGEMLGFTWEQIEQAYMAKNAENLRRQEEGY